MRIIKRNTFLHLARLRNIFLHEIETTNKLSKPPRITNRLVSILLQLSFYKTMQRFDGTRPNVFSTILPRFNAFVIIEENVIPSHPFPSITKSLIYQILRACEQQWRQRMLSSHTIFVDTRLLILALVSIASRFCLTRWNELINRVTSCLSTRVRKLFYDIIIVYRK